MTFSATYRYYPDYFSKKVTDSLKSLIVMHGDNYYFKIGEVEMLKQNDYYVTSDQGTKQLAVSRLMETEPKDHSFAMVDALLKQQGAVISSFDAGKDYQGITIQYQGSEIIKVELIIDKNYFIRKCTLMYQEEIDWAKKKVYYSKLEIVYGKPVKSSSPFPEKQYGIGRFIKLNKDGSLSPTSLYSHFQLTDNTR